MHSVYPKPFRGDHLLSPPQPQRRFRIPMTYCRISAVLHDARVPHRGNDKNRSSKPREHAKSTSTSNTDKEAYESKAHLIHFGVDFSRNTILAPEDYSLVKVYGVLDRTQLFFLCS
jgi:hypothetical protein